MKIYTNPTAKPELKAQINQENKSLEKAIAGLIGAEVKQETDKSTFKYSVEDGHIKLRWSGE